jgi:DNA-binding response OmpR family regulator
MDKAIRTIRVQVGNAFDPAFTELFTNIIVIALDGKYELEFGSSYYGDELLNLAENGQIDIFIVIMNNLLDSHNDTVYDRMENSLKVLTGLKTKFRKPVIALSGFNADSPIVQKAKANADFFFEMPFKIEDFLAAFRTCLKMSINPETLDKDIQYKDQYRNPN